MSDIEIEDPDVDEFLESDESVEELLKEEYSPREPDDEFFSDLQPQVDVREEDPEVSASPDERLIKGTGVAFSDINSDVELDEEISKEEETIATHSGDEFDNAALNAIYKSSEPHRAARARAEMSKREMLDLAADMVDDYFRDHVKTDGIDDDQLKKMKFMARKRIAEKFAEE